MKEIEALYAFLAPNDEEGEGIVGSKHRDGSMMPLVTGDSTMLPLMTSIVQNIASEAGVTMRLVKFTRAEVMQEVTPKDPREGLSETLDMLRTMGIDLKPDTGPGTFHRDIVSAVPMAGTETGKIVTLSCGHKATTYGNLKHTNGKILCAGCMTAGKPEGPKPS